METKKIGTAYGVMFTIQAFGLMVFPYLIGVVLDHFNPGVAETIAAGGKAVYNYTMPLLMMALLGVLGMVFAFMLKHDDKTSGYGLELPNKMD